MKNPVVLLCALINLTSIKKVIYKFQEKNETPIYLIAVGKKDELGIEDIINAKIIKLTLLGKEIPNLNKI